MVGEFVRTLCGGCTGRREADKERQCNDPEESTKLQQLSEVNFPPRFSTVLTLTFFNIFFQEHKQPSPCVCVCSNPLKCGGCLAAVTCFVIKL